MARFFIRAKGTLPAEGRLEETGGATIISGPVPPACG
jgi:hypothetical protein